MLKQKMSIGQSPFNDCPQGLANADSGSLNMNDVSYKYRSFMVTKNN